MTEVLWNSEIENICNSGYLRNSLSVTDALIENFYNEILNKEEKILLELVFKENPTQEELNNLLEYWDIEVKGASKSLMLAYFMKLHPDLSFTSYETPRLKGLLQNIRFKNLKLISHFSKIGKALNKEGIFPIILKGAAMKYLRQELPRIMGDVDIIVLEKDWIKSAKIATDLGYTYSKTELHSIDLHEKNSDEGVLDIHKFIMLDTGKDKKWLKNLFQRAKKKKIFGVQSLLPSYEDLMFITLTNLSRNLRDKTSQAGLLYALFDCKFFLENKPDFNWKIVIENAQLTNSEVQINFAMKFINKISENILPKKIQKEMFFEKETNEYSNKVMFNRFYLENLRKECRALKLPKVIFSPDLWFKYITLKPKYQILKSLRKHPKLIEIFIKDLKGCK